MMKRCISILLILAPLCPAWAQTDVGDAGKKPVAEKKICRSEERTGSIMPTRVCHSNSEWAAIERQNASTVERDRPLATKNSPR